MTLDLNTTAIWLLDTGMRVGIILLLGYLVMSLTRQPARRQRIAEWTFASALLLALLGVLPQFGHVSLRLITCNDPIGGDSESRVSSPHSIPLGGGRSVPTEGNPREPPLTTRSGPPASGMAAAPSRSHRSAAAEDSIQQPSVLLFASLSSWPVVVYAACCLLVLAWLGLGYWRLAHLVRDVCAPSPHVQELWDDLVSKVHLPVRLVVSSRVRQPLTFGLIRPVIIVPAILCRSGQREQLQLVLQHELVHVERRDALTCLLTGLTQVLYFYQPMFWLIRRELRLCQEYVADAWAASSAPSSAEYAQHLVEILSQCTGRKPRAMHGIGVVESRSQLFRRIQMLTGSQQTVDKRCTRRWSSVAGAVLLGLTLLLSIVTVFAERSHAQTDVSTATNESVNHEPSPAVSRAWNVLRQPNTMGIFHGLPQRLDEFLTSPRTGEAWQGVAGGGSLDFVIDVEGDVDGEIVVGFFADPRWWIAPPVQARSFRGPGEYTVHNLPPGKFFVGAMVGGLPQPQAVGVDRRWPDPVTVRTGETARAHLLVSRDFHWSTEVRNSRDFTGDWPPMDPGRLVTVRTVDHEGNSVPYCRITLVRRNRRETYDFHEVGTDEKGYAFCDDIAGKFSIIAHWADFVPESMTSRHQWRKIEKLHDSKTRPVITIRWAPFPTGAGVVTGRVHNQRGEPLQGFHLNISRQVGERQDWSDAHGLAMRIPVTDRSGRFEVKGLAPGSYKITASAFDYHTHVYEWNVDREFTISEGPDAFVEVDVQLEARELFYGRAVYEKGTPVYPGGWTARFQANDSFSMGIEPDGRFRVGLSSRERERLAKNSDGMVEVYSSGAPKSRVTVHVENLSRDMADPSKVVLPLPKQTLDSETSDDSSAAVEASFVSDNKQDVAALKKTAGYLKMHLDGTVKEINFLDQNVTDTDLFHLKGTPRVRKLNLQRTGITDAGLVYLRGLTLLENLDLRGARVTDAGLEQIQHLQSLRSLDIGSTAVTDTGMRHLKRLTKLQHLHVDYTGITDKGLAELRNLVYLETLMLSAAPITDAGLKSLQRMVELRNLSLIGSRVTDAGLTHLSPLTKLENLSLGGVPVSNAGVQQIATFGRLQRLNLLNSEITDDGLPALKPLTNLRSLALGPHITDKGLVHFKDFPKLEALTLPCPGITDAGLVHVEKMTQLTNLRLYDTQVSDKGVGHLTGLKNVILLDLRRTNVTADGIQQLRGLSRLQHLEGP